MKPVAFAWERPADIAAALALAARDDIAVKFTAGGQSLGPMLNLRLVQVDLLVDLAGIEELVKVEESADAITLGACITHADIEDRRVPDLTRGAVPDIASGIAYRAVRNRGTIGGSLCHADPAADWVNALAALGAVAIVDGPAGRSEIAIDDWMTGAFETRLPAGALMTAIRIPRLSPTARWGYYKICRKTGEFANAIGAVLHDEPRGIFRAVIGATGSRPIVFTDAAALFPGRLQPASLDEAIAESALAAAGIADPVDRKLHIAALRRAAARAAS
ncbi:MAG: FAD binding domain-containing protein [Bauldia sp.]